MPFFTSVRPLKLELGNAVIIAARFYAGAKLGFVKFDNSEMAFIVVANEHISSIAVNNGAASRNKFICSRRKIFSSD